MSDILNLDKQAQRRKMKQIPKGKRKTGRTLPEEEEIQQISQ